MVETDSFVESGAEPKANQGGTDRFSSESGLIFEQIRGVRTEFAVIIEQVVANQGGMDRFCGANWGGRSLADPRKTPPKTTLNRDPPLKPPPPLPSV